MDQYKVLAERHIQAHINQDKAGKFNEYLPRQAEHCARKCMELLQNDLLSNQIFDPQELLALAQCAETLLRLRDLNKE